jgi:hypothetical protein
MLTSLRLQRAMLAMPTSDGRFKGIAVPRVPWHEEDPLSPPSERCEGNSGPNLIPTPCHDERPISGYSLWRDEWGRRFWQHWAGLARDG